MPPPALPATPSPTGLTAPAAAPAIAPPAGPALPAARLYESPVPANAPAPALPPAPPKAPWYTAVPLLDWFARAHLLVQIGLVVLFIGVAFLLKFAVDQGWISIELRHLGVVIGALVLGGVGWWLRNRRRMYGLALQGGALAILYLTTYSAFRLYELIPSPVAFAIFFGLGVVGCGLALLGDAPILAFLATAGAFAAPLLTASGAGSYVVLFGYYALLNVGVLAIAIFKSWHGLNLVSFLFTFGVGMTYTFANYAPADYGGMQAFVLFFFVLYLAITILVALRSERRGPASVSVSLAFGLPLATLLWQGMITDHLPHGLGYSALAGAAIYLAVAGFLFYRPWNGSLPCASLPVSRAAAGDAGRAVFLQPARHGGHLGHLRRRVGVAGRRTARTVDAAVGDRCTDGGGPRLCDRGRFGILVGLHGEPVVCRASVLESLLRWVCTPGSCRHGVGLCPLPASMATRA